VLDIVRPSRVLFLSCPCSQHRVDSIIVYISYTLVYDLVGCYLALHDKRSFVRCACMTLYTLYLTIARGGRCAVLWILVVTIVCAELSGVPVFRGSISCALACPVVPCETAVFRPCPVRLSMLVTAVHWVMLVGLWGVHEWKLSI